MNIVALLFMLALYFLPTIIAESRKHNSSSSILVINLFFGWTLVGWIITLAWALSGNVAKKGYH